MALSSVTTRPVPAAAASSTPAAAAAPAAAAPTPSPFTDGLDPRPLPATGYAVDLAWVNRWPTIQLGENTVGGIEVPNQAEAGKPFTIRYGRGPGDLGQQGALKDVVLHYRIDGGPEQKRSLALVTDPSGFTHREYLQLDLPATAKGELEYWFEQKLEDGRTLWDSDFGRNYRTDILPAGGATLRFDDLWGQAVQGPLRAGGTLRLGYDTDRLKQFLRGTQHHGAETWNVTAFVSFDGRPPVSVPLTIPTRGQFGQTTGMQTLEAAIAIPGDAKQAQVWFRGSAYGGSVFGGNAWDSNFGKNYVYPVEPAAV